MGILREPLEVDFIVDPRSLTKEEQQKISDFIKADKKRKKVLFKKRHLRVANRKFQ